MQIDVKRVLMLWGGFVRFTDCRGYPTMQSFMRESPEVRSQRRYLARLDDDTLEKVDKQVRYLEQYYTQQFQLLFYRYVCGYEPKEVWRKLDISRSAFFEQQALAESFVAGALCGAEIKLFI